MVLTDAPRWSLVLLGICVFTTACRRSDRKPTRDERSAIAGAPGKQDAGTRPGPFRLPARKAGFKTSLATSNPFKEAPDKPPAEIFELVRYRAPLGENAAYVSPVRAGEKRPALVWIHGGFYFGISSFAWQQAPRSNDQSASAFREADIVLMLPSLRGTNDNAGDSECFLGEVEDVIAAGRFLKSRPDVDPERIYLGGHSTGGTMVLLTAVSTDLFRGVFAFGPVLSARDYGNQGCIPDGSSALEVRLRTPVFFFADIRTPTFIIEGANGGNGPYHIPESYRGKAPLTTIMVPGADHFSVLRPGSEVVAETILKDAGQRPDLDIGVEAIVSRMKTEEASPTSSGR